MKKIKIIKTNLENNNCKIKKKDYMISILIMIGIAYFLTFYIFKEILTVNILLTLDNLTVIFLSFFQVVFPVLLGLFYIYFKYHDCLKKNFKKILKLFNIKVVLLGYIAILLISVVYSFIIKKLGIKTSENVFDFISETGDLSILWFFLFFGVLAAIYEEIIFRGILFDLFRDFFNSIFSYFKKKERNSSLNKKTRLNLAIILTILITSLAFGFIHTQYSLVLIINVILVGLVLGFIRYKYGIINNIVIHMINNFVIIFFSMILPVFFYNNIYLKVDNKITGLNKEQILKLKKQFDNEENIILKQFIIEQVKTNKGIKDSKKIKEFLEKTNEDLYNPYIYKYFFVTKSELNHCLNEYSNSGKIICKDKLLEVYNKFKKYEQLARAGLITVEQLNKIIGFEKFIHKTFPAIFQ